MSSLTNNPNRMFNTTAEKLTAYLHGSKHISLNPKETELLERAETAFTTWLKKRNRKKSADVLMQLYNYSKASAYNDLNNAESIFGVPQSGHKEMDRAIAKEMASKTFDVAFNTKDLEQMNKATMNYIKASGADKDNPNLPNPEDFKIAENVIMIDLASIERYKEFIDAKAYQKIVAVLKELKIYDFLEEQIQDIPHEDLS